VRLRIHRSALTLRRLVATAVADVTAVPGQAVARRPSRQPAGESRRPGPHRSRGRLGNFLAGLLGSLTGLTPHVLHHVGLLAGTALVAGSGGTALFAVVGLVGSIPLLLRLHRRFGTWKASALGLLAFGAMFALSALVIGPAINGEFDSSSPSAPAIDHGSHH
jgi:hypothetical protein